MARIAAYHHAAADDWPGQAIVGSDTVTTTPPTSAGQTQSYWVSYFDGKSGTSGSAYSAYANANPTLSPSQAALGYDLSIGLSGLGSGIGAGASFVGTTPTVGAGAVTSAVGGGGASTAAGTAAHPTLVVVAVELLAVGLFTLLAGISNDVGTIVVLFMVGLWLIFLITDSQTVAGIGSALTTIANGA